ncbi:MAG: hypothetical protein HY017_26305 [Betaproteobacteria bacterium]|nr:hypothetical protein [Betaproteobacteria bacterium]
MKAKLVRRDREVWGRGVVEVVIWEAPKPVPASQHPFKYRLVYVIRGRRAVGYDNERGKGDHKHVRGREMPYDWVSIEQLFADFWNDVKEIERDET